MCIVVDANAAHELRNRTDDGKPVLRWLLDRKRRAGLVIGGKLIAELHRAGFGDTLAELSRAGRLHRIADGVVDETEAELVRLGKCESNDPHVVALVLATGCQLVFTRDKPLHRDLKRNAKTGQKISIYQRATHIRLLTECVCI